MAETYLRERQALGRRIKVLRGKLTQANFGRLVGLDQPRVSDLENATHQPRAMDVRQIAKTHSMTTDELLGLKLGNGKSILTPEQQQMLSDAEAIGDEALALAKDIEDLSDSLRAHIRGVVQELSLARSRRDEAPKQKDERGRPASRR